MSERGPKRIASKAFRIIAHPHYGVLVGDKLYNLMEWNRLERQRESNRKYMNKIRKELTNHE